MSSLKKSINIAIDIVIICDYKKSWFKEVMGQLQGIAMFSHINCNGLTIIVWFE